MPTDLNSLDTDIAGSDALTLASLLGMLKKRAWMILGIALSVPSLVAFVVSKQPKVYEASASIVIESNAPQYLGEGFRDVVDMETSWWGSQEHMATELHVLKSYSQAVAVAGALCELRTGPTHDGPPALLGLMPTIDCRRPESVESAAPLLQGMLRLEPVKDSQVVNLVVDLHDPELAAVIVNAMADVYIRRNLEHRLTQSEGAAKWLGGAYGDVTSQLNAAETALIDFKRKNNVVAVGIEDQQNDLSSRRKKISDEMSNVEVKLIGLRAQRAEYAILKSDDVLDSVTPGVTDNPTVAKLKENYLSELGKLSEMRGRYLDKHPALIAEQSRIESIRGDLKHEAELASKGVDAQYDTLMKEQRDLKSAMDVAIHEALQLEQRAIEYDRLKRNFDRLNHLSEQVGGRERETSLAGHLKTNNVRILDTALVPTAAISPNVPRAVGMGLAVALAISLALAFFLEWLDSTVKTQDDIERKGLSFLGLIPTISAEDRSPESQPPPGVAELVRGGSKDLYTLSRPKSAVAECCRAIRTNLLFMSPDHPARSIVISSAGPQEGKTTTAVSLAISLAQSGLRVLLVDTDMRRPRLHKVFGIPATSSGLSKAVVGEGDVLSMICETGVPNLSLLPCGALPPNPAELIHAERFKRIVGTLLDNYDRVLFDSPPIGAVTDAVILAQLTEGTILVVKAGKTTRDSLAFVARSLKTGGGAVNILGCVLNDLDVTTMGRYGYSYYARYGYYYRQEEAPTPPTSG